jgi:hypothetical protein
MKSARAVASPLARPIELQAGPDSPLRVAVWLVWLAAVASCLANFPAMPGWLAWVCGVLLAWSFPLRKSVASARQRLMLHPDGQVLVSGEPATWKQDIWRSRWYTVVRIEKNGRHWPAWVSARQNPAHEYRRLGIWSRYSPQQQRAPSQK